ncbi:MAG: hypothetical protein ACHQ2Z_10135 [Elusimicrobiota bacterium]
MTDIADSKPGFIEVEIAHSPLAFFYGFFTPTVELNGRKERRSWGTHSFEVTPGDYEVAVSYPWFLSSECGKNSIRVAVGPGEMKKVRYCAGLIRYLPGRIGVD